MNDTTDLILIPGFWLDASSWDDVIPALKLSGMNPRPLTLPGVGAPEADVEGIGMADWIAAVVAEIDAAEGDVVVVGHSAGANVAWGAVDARPDRVARVIFVDNVPPAPDTNVAMFQPTGPVMPFPGWDVFDERDVADLDQATRARAAAMTRTVPSKVATDAIALTDPRRYAVPVTVLSGSRDEEELRESLAQRGPAAAEFDAIEDAEIVHLGTGHWPQFSQPQHLAEAIIAAVRR